jgi:hypothetical protein
MVTLAQENEGLRSRAEGEQIFAEWSQYLDNKLRMPKELAPAHSGPPPYVWDRQQYAVSVAEYHIRSGSDRQLRAGLLDAADKVFAATGPSGYELPARLHLTKALDAVERDQSSIALDHLDSVQTAVDAFKSIHPESNGGISEALVAEFDSLATRLRGSRSKEDANLDLSVGTD